MRSAVNLFRHFATPRAVVPSRDEPSASGQAGSSAGPVRLVACAGESFAVCAGNPVELVLDAQGVPSWVMLIPAGTFSLIDGRGPFDNSGVAAVVADSMARAGGVDFPVDYDHALENVEKTGGKAIAAGWIKELAVREGALWGRIEWTDTAAAHIKAREYRYLSPVFASDKADKVKFFARAGLTNKPAITTLPALAASRRHATSLNPHEEPSMKTLLEKLAEALGLAANVTEDALVAAASATVAKLNAITQAGKLTAAASAEQLVAAIAEHNIDRSKFVAASEYQRVTALLGETQKAATAKAIEDALAGGLRDGKIAPASKDYWQQTCASAGSAEPLLKYLASAPVLVPPGERLQTDPKPAAGKLTEEQKQVCASLGLTEEQYLKAAA